MPSPPPRRRPDRPPLRRDGRRGLRAGLGDRVGRRRLRWWPDQPAGPGLRGRVHLADRRDDPRVLAGRASGRDAVHGCGPGLERRRWDRRRDRHHEPVSCPVHRPDGRRRAGHRRPGRDDPGGRGVRHPGPPEPGGHRRDRVGDHRGRPGLARRGRVGRTLRGSGPGGRRRRGLRAVRRLHRAVDRRTRVRAAHRRPSHRGGDAHRRHRGHPIRLATAARPRAGDLRGRRARHGRQRRLHPVGPGGLPGGRVRPLVDVSGDDRHPRDASCCASGSRAPMPWGSRSPPPPSP